MDRRQVLNDINGIDRVFGVLCKEAENSYQQGNYLAALLCLFMFAEQMVKLNMDEIGGNYHQILSRAREKYILDENEFNLLTDLKTVRNKVFHENHYSLSYELHGIMYPIDEDETKRMLYKIFANNVFKLFVKIN